MSNSAPKHLENSQRCCFLPLFMWALISTARGLGVGDGRPFGQAPYFPWPAGCPLPRPDQAERRERSEGIDCFASLQTHSNTSGETHSAVKTSSGCAFWLFQPQKGDEQIWERVRNPEKNAPGWRRGHYHAFASLLSRHGVRLINGDRACKVITGLLLRLSGA